MVLFFSYFKKSTSELLQYCWMKLEGSEFRVTEVFACELGLVTELLLDPAEETQTHTGEGLAHSDWTADLRRV